MNRLFKWLLVSAVVLAAWMIVAPQAAQAARWGRRGRYVYYYPPRVEVRAPRVAVEVPRAGVDVRVGPGVRVRVGGIVDVQTGRGAGVRVGRGYWYRRWGWGW